MGPVIYPKFIFALESTSRRESTINLIWSAWASIYEVYVVVVTAITLLLKLDAQVHDWASKETSLGGLNSSLEPVTLVIRV